MIPKETLKKEQLDSLEWAFQRWFKEVRLNGEERDEIERIIRELRFLID